MLTQINVNHKYRLGQITVNLEQIVKNGVFFHLLHSDFSKKVAQKGKRYTVMLTNVFPVQLQKTDFNPSLANKHFLIL